MADCEEQWLLVAQLAMIIKNRIGFLNGTFLKELLEFPHEYASKRQKASSRLPSQAHAHTDSSALHFQHMLAPEENFIS